MKKILFSVLIIFCTSYSSTVYCQGCPHLESKTLNSDIICNTGDYELLFEDDFNGNTLDSKKWEKEEGVLRDFNFHNQKVFYSPDNVKVQNGYLQIITNRNPNPATPLTYWCPESEFCSKKFDFISGEIKSLGQFPIEGLIEARIKMPKSLGLWPAYWLYSEYNGNYNEIDIAEVFNYIEEDANITTNLFYKANYDGSSPSCPKHFTNLWSTYIGKFCTYKVIWTKYKIEWYIDGNKIRELYRFRDNNAPSIVFQCNELQKGTKYSVPIYFPLDPMHVILNTAVLYGTHNPPNSLFNSDTMLVDYVRVYAKRNCDRDINIPLYISSLRIDRIISGKNITYDGEIVIPSQASGVTSDFSLKNIAVDKVILDNGFSVDVNNDGYFSAENKECNSQ